MEMHLREYLLAICGAAGFVAFGFIYAGFSLVEGVLIFFAAAGFFALLCAIDEEVKHRKKRLKKNK